MIEQETASGEPAHFSIVVANWNGEAFLAKCLSSALLSARQTGRPAEVLVVDDASSDGSAEIVRRQFPGVRLLVHSENRGFAETVNEGIENARGRFIVLLNNDVVVRSDFCATMLAHFDRDDGRLFGVTAKTVQWDGREPNYVKMDAVWRRGDMALVWCDPPQAEPTLFLQAGACAFARERFLELGGMETIFAPGYWEDFDLSWRSLARGWRNVYEPASPVFHLGKASFRRRYGDEVIRQLDARNHFLFVWLNLADARLLLSHCARLPFRIGREVLGGRIDTLRAVLRALRRIGEVMRCRRRRRHGRRRSDREILALIDTSGSRLSNP